MKKLIVVILVVVLAMVCLVGCGDNTNMTNSSNIHIEFWTDEVTGVQYVIYDRVGGYAGMGGITPRLNSDGSVYIVD